MNSPFSLPKPLVCFFLCLCFLGSAWPAGGDPANPVGGADQKLAVVATSPVGPTESKGESFEILVTFNQPMAALEAVPSDLASGPLKIEPAIKGKYRWRGTSALAFIPTEPLPLATAFKVTVPAGVKAISGSVLEKEVSWTFETPRPDLINTLPGHKQPFVELDHFVYLNFNQPINPATAQKYMSLTVEDDSGKTKPVPFTLRRPTEAEIKAVKRPVVMKNTLVMVPGEKYPLGSAIHVRLAAGMPGAGGNLGLAIERNMIFYTYNPFKFVSAELQYPDLLVTWIKFKFSNPVKKKDLRQSLTITPEVRFTEDDSDYMDTIPYFYSSTPRREYVSEFQIEVRAETTYQVKISAQLRDISGQSLSQDATATITTQAVKPSFFMPTGMAVLESKGSLTLPCTTINMGSVSRRGALVPRDKIVPMIGESYRSYDYWEVNYAQDALNKLTYTWNDTWNIPIKRNVRTRSSLDLKGLLGQRPCGYAFLEINGRKLFLQVTNLGVDAKFSRENNLIWVTQLDTSQAVADATVELRDHKNRVLFTGKTGPDGLCETPGWDKLGLTLDRSQEDEGEGAEVEYEGDYEYGGYWGASSRQPQVWVFVTKGEDEAFTTSDWGLDLSPENATVLWNYNPDPGRMAGHVFTERGLYKAGEKVHIKGVFRERSGGRWVIPKPSPLKLKVKDSRGAVVSEKQVKLTDWGSFHQALDLKESAPTGWYNIQVADGRGKTIARDHFRVEAYKPAQFEVKATAQRKEYYAGEDLAGQITARYLFGATMSGDKVSWAVRLNPYPFTPPGWDEYSFNEESWWNNYSNTGKLLASGEGALDTNGALPVTATLDLTALGSDAAATVEGTVTSLARQALSGRCQALVHRGDFAIGLKQGSYLADAHKPLKIKMVTVATDGKAVGGKNVEVVISRREWRSVRQAGVEGRYEWVSQSFDTEAKRLQLISAVAPLDFEFTPEQTGCFYLKATAKDDQGRVTSSGCSFYAIGEGFFGWEQKEGDQIELVPEKKQYKIGDTARVMIKSPFEKCRALITLEGEAVLYRQVVELTGNTPCIEIPIKEEHLPNVYVCATLIRGRIKEAKFASDGTDLAKPACKIGYANLVISSDPKRLTVEVTSDKPTYQPQEQVTVNLFVKNHQGQGVPAEITLAVVDKGVLNLIDFQTPNSFGTFYNRREFSVFTSDSRIQILGERNQAEKGENTGGGGGFDANYRNEFLTVPYYNAQVLTDASGQATVQFKLPDNLTSFKIMATVHTRESEFGAGESTFTVSKPLLLLEALPRFLRLGDTFSGGVTVHNNTEQEAAVSLSASAKGAELTGITQKPLTLKSNQAGAIRFDYQASTLGKATLRFAAQAAANSDALEVKVPVIQPRLTETVALYSQTEATVTEKIKLPERIIADIGQLQFTGSSTALVGLESSLDYLIGYPYGCLEQRMSKILPMIESEELIRAFKLAPLKGKELRKIVQNELDQVYQFQLDDGGFSFWKDGERSSCPFISAYTMYVLSLAKTQDYRVDSAVTNRAVDYLKRVLTRSDAKTDWEYPYSLNCRLTSLAYASYVLALWSQPDAAVMHRLYDRRDQLSVFGKAMLLRAMAKTGAEAAMRQELVQLLNNKIRLEATSAHYEEEYDSTGYLIFHSNVRTTAVVLATLLQTTDRVEHAEKIIRWLIDNRKRGYWNSTQDNIAAFEAFSTYFRMMEKEIPDFTATVMLETRQILKELFKGRTLDMRSATLPLNKLPRGKEMPVTITKEGQGRLYYGIRFNYAPLDPLPVRDEGFAVSKQIRVASTDKEVTEFKAGEIYKVTLAIVTNKERSYVVVNDPLPAGFEVVNTAFATENQALVDQASRGGREDELWWWGGFNHFETYDDRVLLFADYFRPGAHTYSYLVRAGTTGRFQMPSTKAEEMYNPEVFGWSQERLIEIK